VYALAHYKDVDELQTLSLDRMLMTLKQIHPITDGDHESANIANLLEYVYSHTDPLDHSPEPMRKLVTRFAAFNFNSLWMAPEILDLINHGGDIVSCLVHDISRRLGDFENPPQVRRYQPTRHLISTSHIGEAKKTFNRGS
jgi:hypothetical protein